MGRIEKLLARFGFYRPKGQDPVGPVGTGSVSLPTIEVFARPGHGKTSFLWAALFMLRKLNLVWPGYHCWPDEATEEELKGIHRQVHEGLLPPPASESKAIRYLLQLNKMERWGDKPLVVWDRLDPVFSPPAEEAGAGAAAFNWNAPAFWLLSLADLKEVEIEFLDMLFEDLIRARVRQGFGLHPRPFRLVIVLTKADAIPNLPLLLRTYLKEDPLWQAVSGEVTLAAARQDSPAAPPALGPEALQLYLATLWRVHQEIHAWLETTLSGRTLIRRAADHHVDLRFALTSATGSGIASAQTMRVPWTPKRVLDPLFWALELAAVA